jgi:putative peptidoglycan binding protein
MKRCELSVICLIAALSASIHTAGGQVINATMQNASSRAVTSRAAPAAKPIANTAIAPRVAARPTSFTPRTFNSYAPRVIAQPGMNLRPNNSPVVRTLNPTLATIKAQPIARVGEPQTITLDPATRGKELRTLAAMRTRRGFRTHNATLAKSDPQRPATTHNPTLNQSQPTAVDPVEQTARPRGHNKDGDLSFSDACRRHWHEWHDRNWWHDHCDTIVFVNIGYYFLDGSYWYPAFGYDPLNSYYDYDGPIYTYGNLLPDEVIANVQVALQDAGYYFGQITGSLNFETRAALANFQRDYGLPITGAIDEPTVETLGLYQSGTYQSGDVLNSNY